MPRTPGSIFAIGDVLAAPDFGAFALAPDGRHLALSRIEYVRSTETRRSRVTVIALDGDPAAPPAETVVFTGDSDGWSPEFADDGAAILFLSDLAGEARPWVALQPGATPAPVEGVTRMAFPPKWRPGAPRPGLPLPSFPTPARPGAPHPGGFVRA